jgi:SAM-dependent methyltransferase
VRRGAAVRTTRVWLATSVECNKGYVESVFAAKIPEAGLDEVKKQKDLEMDYEKLKRAKQVYESGGNVIEFLRKENSGENDISKIIEISYELQAGDHIEYVKRNIEKETDYAEEMANLLEAHLGERRSLVDVGSGELTTISIILQKLSQSVKTAYAFDISWSRLFKGLGFAKSTLGAKASTIVPFVADMRSIPLPTSSVDVVTSAHALEPNGSNLDQILLELFRVCKETLVLFEPSYELNSEEGKARMDKLGYIRDIEGQAQALGGAVLDIVPLRNIANPLNPTACYVSARQRKMWQTLHLMTLINFASPFLGQTSCLKKAKTITDLPIQG